MIRMGFQVGDRWPHCRACGHVAPRPFRRDDGGEWLDESGVPFSSVPECPKCGAAGRLRLAEVEYADGLLEGVEPRTIRWAGNRYVVVLSSVQKISRDTPRLHVFFQEESATTKEEILYWAERAASKNGFPLLLPKTFENVEARLPATSEEATTVG